MCVCVTSLDALSYPPHTEGQEQANDDDDVLMTPSSADDSIIMVVMMILKLHPSWTSDR